MPSRSDLERDPETGQIRERVSPAAVVDLFEDLDLPFVSSKMVADEFGCTTETARTKLNELVDRGALRRVNLDRRRTVYVHPDYAAVDDIADALRDAFDLRELDTTHLRSFADEPYCLLPKGDEEAWVVVPRFVPFHVGYLDRQTASYNVFVVNKYIDWIYDLPDEIREAVGIQPKYDQAIVEDGLLKLADNDEYAEAWDEFATDRHQDAIPPDDVLEEMEWNRFQSLASRRGVYGENASRDEMKAALRKQRDTSLPLKQSREFDVIAQLIDDGNLPFATQPVADAHLRAEPEGVALDDPAHTPEGASYQHRAWEEFLETGMIGVYWPPGAGKTFLALYAGDRLRGQKLVVVPSNTLKEQWGQRIEARCHNPEEWEIQTYQYLRRHADEYERDGPMLTVFDEHHHLPADTYAKIATIDTTYRIGLSGSPYREDERVDYIFALSGYPVGLDWEELVALGVVETPPAKLYLYETQRQKRADLADIVAEHTGKILVLCDSLDEGHELSDRLGVPFVHGETTERMQTLRDHRVVIGSRVADEGVSLEELDLVVEFDFHGSSRRQEIQRYGRVMHGDGESGYIIQMTDDEYQRSGDRLMALEEKGVRVVPERRS
jgi:DNA excision repair protein ERCC-3